VIEDELRSLKISETAKRAEREISNCQVGNEMRSLRDLIDCQEDRAGNFILPGGQ
jgi:hypothetical protein